MPINYGTWFVIAGSELRAALQRAHDGEDPEMVYVEVYANSEVGRQGDAEA